MINEYLNKVIKSLCSIDVNQLLEELSNEEKEVSTLKRLLSDSRNKVDSKVRQIVQLESKVGNLEDAFSTLQSSNTNFLSMIESNRTDIDSLQKEKDTLSLEIENNLQEINNLRLINTSLREQLNHTEIDLHNANYEYMRLQENITQIRTKYSDLEHNIIRISDEKTELNTQIRVLQAQISDKII